MPRGISYRVGTTWNISCHVGYLGGKAGGRGRKLERVRAGRTVDELKRSEVRHPALHGKYRIRLVRSPHGTVGFPPALRIETAAKRIRQT